MTGNRRRLNFYSDPRVLVPLWVVVLAGAVWFGAAPLQGLIETARLSGVPQTWARWVGAESITVDPLWVSIGVGFVVAIVGVIGAGLLTRGDRRRPVPTEPRNLVELDPIRRRG